VVKAKLKTKTALGVQSRFAKLDGVRLHYLAAGKGEPVLLLHGYAQNSHMWRPLIAELAKTNTVIAPDLRGFGQSSKPANSYDKPPSGYDKTSMARDLHALAAALGLKRVRICGHDIGLMVAYAYAAQYPTEVERIAC
jgi:pimeloyl-ACP methyl ester carboxylesterase